MFPKNPGGHEQENVPLDKDVQIASFRHGFDMQGFSWQEFPTKLIGHEHENILLDKEVQLALF